MTHLTLTEALNVSRVVTSQVGPLRVLIVRWMPGDRHFKAGFNLGIAWLDTETGESRHADVETRVELGKVLAKAPVRFTDWQPVAVEAEVLKLAA